jgi:2-polyprenyl-3-methyl-5-hydroxy-6-metoxy-1,4-benzoquinol methylase
LEKYGKPLDLARLKVDVKRKEEAQLLERRAKELLDLPLETVKCFVCGSEDNELVTSIFGFEYVQCRNCSHVYVRGLPDFSKVDETYRSNLYDKFVSSIYTNKNVSNFRVENIAKPKVRFVSEFCKAKGKWLDLGCGTGEVVKAAKDLGWNATGIDRNKSEVDFGKDNYGVQIVCGNANSFERMEEFDVISIFNVLEHLTNPKELLENVSSKSKEDVILVVEVPNFDSVSTFTQLFFRKNINRHMVPFLHVQFYTLASIKRLLDETGFELVGKWVFGQDFFELLTNICLLKPEFSKSKLYKYLMRKLNDLQLVFDRDEKSDNLLLVARKKKT